MANRHPYDKVRRYTILATACVTPDPNAAVARRNPALRLGDYVHALSWWMERDNPALGDLVVLESSGFDAARLRQLILERCTPPLKRQIEVLSYHAPPIPSGVHYGYAEFRMIDDLMDQSTLLGTQFIKTTGRYTFPSIARLLQSTSPEIRFSIDSNRRPRVPLVFKTPSFGCHAWLFICERGFYDRNIRKLYLRADNAPRRTHVEGIIYDTLIHLHGKDGVSLRFPVQCSPCGTGGNNQNLSSRRKRVESRIRALQRRVMPWLWI